MKLSVKCIIWFLLFILMISSVSCGMKKTLVITDPFWEDFSGSSVNFYRLKKAPLFWKKGIFPVFKVYDGDDADFQGWLAGEFHKKDFESVILSYPFVRFGKIGDSEEIPIVYMGGQISEDSGNLAVRSRQINALKKAASIMKVKWEKEGRQPVVVLRKDPETFTDDYQALLEGWGDQPAVFEDNIQFIDPGMADVEGRLNSFYNRYDFQENSWSLLVSADQDLPDVLKTWPVNDSVLGFLTSGKYEFLPENISYLIFQDNLKLLDTAAEIIRSEKKTGILRVESRLYKR